MMMGGGGGEDEKALPLPAGAAATTTTTTTKAASSLVLPNDHVRQFVSFLHKRIGESSSSSSVSMMMMHSNGPGGIKPRSTKSATCTKSRFQPSARGTSNTRTGRRKNSWWSFSRKREKKKEERKGRRRRARRRPTTRFSWRCTKSFTFATCTREPRRRRSRREWKVGRRIAGCSIAF